MTGCGLALIPDHQRFELMEGMCGAEVSYPEWWTPPATAIVRLFRTLEGVDIERDVLRKHRNSVRAAGREPTELGNKAAL
jgi:hypothetical protein